MLSVCVFGLGEAGSEIASGLVAAGARVHAYDPLDVATPHGIERSLDPARAVAGADLVIALTAAADSMTALEQALGDMPPDCHYADFASATPNLKRELASTAAIAGVRFTDVAVMGTVPGRGLSTPLLASGTSADAFASMVRPFEVDVNVVGDAPGLAATHKLVRSVFVKGLAAVLIEAMHAARETGIETETWNTIVEQIDGADEAFLARLIDGTKTHAVRRHAEMEAAGSLLADLQVSSIMTRATTASLANEVAASEVEQHGTEEVSRHES